MKINSKYILCISLVLCLSIMYQIYFLEFHDGEIIGGGLFRLSLKIVFLLLFLISIKRYLLWGALFLNLPYKIPLFYIISTLFILIPFLSGSYYQALNIFFFLPILFIDWNKPGHDNLYIVTWKIIVAVVFIQLLLDPIFKAYTEVSWSNSAFIGGMGNPNVFGLFLIVSGIACSILLSSRFKYMSIVLFLSTVLTGSLVTSIIGLSCFFLQISYLLFRSPVKSLFFIIAPLTILIVSKKYVDYIAINHALNKFIALLQFASGKYESGSESITARTDYFENGLNLVADSPLSLMFGHPGFMPMYNGDGLWVSFFVTYGLPVTLCFFVVNLLLCYRGVISRSPDLLFSSCVIIVMLVYFITNRILDYWPAALIYMLAFTYLATKGVRRAGRKTIGNAVDLPSSHIILRIKN